MDVALIGALAARDGLVRAEDLAVAGAETADAGTVSLSPDDYVRLRAHVQEVCRQQMDLDETGDVRNAVTRARFRNVVLQTLRDLGISVPEAEVPALVGRLFDDILGFGPVEKYFFDPDVTEIIVSGVNVRVMRRGRREPVVDRFESPQHARRVVERMIAPTGRRLDLASPRVSARLFDGSRLMAHIAPVAVDGITATIRRFRQDIAAEALVENGACSADLMGFLRACVLARQNIVISGGTGSGKTTWVNVLASFIPPDESVVTVEDTAELQLQHPDVRRLEGRPANIEGQGEVTLSDLVADALRMFPDRIIVGECRRKEAFDMLQAMNTGHLGSMTTVHANSAWHCILRLHDMVQMAGMNMPRDAILDQIAGAVDIIVHIVREKTGRRRVDHVVEVVGPVRGPDGVTRDVELNELWRYVPETGSFAWVAKKFYRAGKFGGK
ncbi:MAG: CpaF family protein [Desulfotomaculales bacterium]